MAPWKPTLDDDHPVEKVFEEGVGCFRTWRGCEMVVTYECHRRRSNRRHSLLYILLRLLVCCGPFNIYSPVALLTPPIPFP